MVQRLKVRKTKQKTDTEWKVEVSRKLEELSELRGLRKNVHRIAVALEKLAGIEGQNSDEKLLSWLESEGEETKVQGSKEKGKQREEKLDGEDEEEGMERQEEDNEMEGVEEGGGSFFLVAYSVRTRV